MRASRRTSGSCPVPVRNEHGDPYRNGAWVHGLDGRSTRPSIKALWLFPAPLATSPSMELAAFAARGSAGAARPARATLFEPPMHCQPLSCVMHWVPAPDAVAVTASEQSRFQKRRPTRLPSQQCSVVAPNRRHKGVTKNMSTIGKTQYSVDCRLRSRTTSL